MDEKWIINPKLITLTEAETKDKIMALINSIIMILELYRKLLNAAPNELHYDLIENIRSDELELFLDATNLYNKNFGTLPLFPSNEIGFSDYKEGLEKALENESSLIDFTRDVQTNLEPGDLGYELFSKALIMGLEHQPIIGILYSQLLPGIP